MRAIFLINRKYEFGNWKSRSRHIFSIGKKKIQFFSILFFFLKFQKFERRVCKPKNKKNAGLTSLNQYSLYIMAIGPNDFQ
jgi:hypothetical protein